MRSVNQIAQAAKTASRSALKLPGFATATLIIVGAIQLVSLMVLGHEALILRLAVGLPAAILLAFGLGLLLYRQLQRW